MVLGRLLRSISSDSTSFGNHGAEGKPDVQDRCLADAHADSRLIPSGQPVLFVDLEGTLLRTFSRDDLRSIPEDTHYSQSVQGEQLLVRIRPLAMEFLARMKRDWGLAIAVYAASARSAVKAKVEVLEKAYPDFRFDFVVDQETANAWDDGAKRLRLIFGGEKAARDRGFLIDTKDSHVHSQEKASSADKTIVNAVEVAEYGPFMADKSGQLADMRIIYGMMTAAEVQPTYTIFRNFEKENATFKTWLQKATALSGHPSARSREDGGLDDEEVDWELVDEAATQVNTDGPLAPFEFLMVEGACEARRTNSRDEGDAKKRHEAVADVKERSKPANAGNKENVPSKLDPAAPQEDPIEKARGDCASDGSSTTTDDEPSYRCVMCETAVFKACDILSSNYNAQTSPGYLLGVARNVQISEETQTAIYTTGRYEIQDVSCAKCSAVLGVTYTSSADSRNQYKVGKFLVGRDRLQLPPGVVHPMDKKN